MKTFSSFADLLKPGMLSSYLWSYYEPHKKRVKKLIKKHPRAAGDLWDDAFYGGIDWSSRNNQVDTKYDEDDE